MDQQLIKQKIDQVGPILQEEQETNLFTEQKPLEQQLQSPVNTNQLNKEEFEKALFERMKTRESFQSKEITEVSNKLGELSKKITKVDKELSFTSKSVSERCRQLLKDTASAIKVTYNSFHSNKLTNSRFLDAKLAVHDATKVVEQVSEKVEEDKKQHATIEELCENIIHGVGFTYSKMYKNVVDAAKNYMKLDTTQRLESAEYSQLVNAVNTYVESRSKGGTKKKYFWSSGAKRMEWMKNLQGVLKKNDYEVSTEEERLKLYSEEITKEESQIEDVKTLDLKINTRVEALAKIPHPEWIKENEFKHQKNDCMYEIMKLYITDEKLKPDYVRSHKEEFDHYIKVINDVKSILGGYNSKTIQKIEKETGSNFMKKSFDVFNYYKELESYVKCCQDNKDEEATVIKEKIVTWKRKEEYREYADKFLDFELNRDTCFERILKIFPLEKYEHAVAEEVLRFRTLVKTWQINDNGEPASDKDMAIYKENLRLFSSLFEGSLAEYIHVVDEKYKNYLAGDLLFDERLMDHDYVIKHCVELHEINQIYLNYQNLMAGRREIKLEEAKDFAKKHFNSRVEEEIDKIGETATVVGGYVENIVEHEMGSQYMGYREIKADNQEFLTNMYKVQLEGIFKKQSK